MQSKYTKGNNHAEKYNRRKMPFIVITKVQF